MPLQYTSVLDADFSRGIDVRSAENQLSPGFVKDLLNADVIEKRVRKRAGYQGYAGNVPIRVERMEYDSVAQEICFILPTAVSLENIGVSLESVQSSPIVVYGRSSTFSTGNGPFVKDGPDAVRYYPSFTVPIRHALIGDDAPHTFVIAGDEHGLTTTNLFMQTVESTSLINRSWFKFIPNNERINKSTYDISVDYQTFGDKNAFVFFADETPVPGSSFVYSTTVPTGTTTFSIPASTHNLSNFNIIFQFQLDLGAQVLYVLPDLVTVDSSGTINITVTNGTGVSAPGYAIISTTPLANVVSGVVPGSSIGTVTIPNAQAPWIFYSIFLDDGSGVRELVQPESIDYDDVTKAITFTFDNESTQARNFTVSYKYGDIRSNKLCVSDTSVTVVGTDARPQITIWGLDHGDIYITPKSAREGWVSHIDSYRRSGEQRLVCGLGGNLFSARSYEEAASQYAYALLYPNLNTRTSSIRRYGPGFWATGETPGRTRGYITLDGGGAHWANVSSVEYDSGNGWTKYTLDVPNKGVFDSDGNPTTADAIISSLANLEDYLTVQNMSYRRHEGAFKVQQVTEDATHIYVWVVNSSNSSDFDDLNTGGEAGVFTDQLLWTESPAPYIPQDIMVSEAFGPDQVSRVTSSLGSFTMVDGWTDLLEIPVGVYFTAQRSSSLIPLRNPNPALTESVTNLVKGDMISYTGIQRLLRVQSINSDATDRSLDITESLGVATAVLATGDTTHLSSGTQVLLASAGQYTGIQTVQDIVDSTSFTFNTDQTGSYTGATLVGATIQVDESLSWQDSVGDTLSFRVEDRWIPIEAPDDSFDLTPNTHISYLKSFPYNNQPFLRSTMVADNLYTTNGSDEVLKYDGSSLYRAGLPDWQPGLFVTQDTTASAKIVISNRTIAYTARSIPTGRLTISEADQQAIPVGTTVRLSGSTQTYTIRDYVVDTVGPANSYVLMDRALDSSVSTPSGTAAEIAVFRYYFRLNAVDVNHNIIASAVTGFQDHVVELTANAAVNLKLVGFPNWDIYDFDRLEVQIYRTRQNTVAPFYKVTTLPLDFNNTTGYVQFTDSFADSDLTDLDEVNTALKGQELGTAFSEPLRSKYITSIGNRLVTANITDYPQLDFQIVGPSTLTDATFADGQLFFRRDHTDTASDTNMTDRVRYRWINGPTGTASAFSAGANQFSFTTSSAESASAGSWVYLTYATTATSGRDLTYSGWWQIATVVGTTVTINLSGAAAASTYPDRYVISQADSAEVPVLLGTDGNLGMVNGDSFDTFDAMRRMSLAISASMRMVDTSLNSMSDFTPWLMARGGNDTPPAGRLVVRQPKSSTTAMEVVPIFSGYQLFINSISRDSSEQVGASTRVFPSRLLVSYENYPEIFDSPDSILDTDSDSAIDVNPADGQEITGIIPFFGETAFTAAQQAAVLVVFKTNSIYLVDINQKKLGNQAVQRIETEGLGCTAPFSIASTKSGIMFANESGIYCLRRTQAIEYLGKYMERNWTEKVDLNELALCQGHHYGVGRMYKLSVPLAVNVDETTGYLENSDVYVYNHTNEGATVAGPAGYATTGAGAWSRYDNHPATGWANIASDAFFGATVGRVFQVRRELDITDYRDDHSSINMVLQARPNDFGAPGIRKIVDKLIISYRTHLTSVGTSLQYSIDLQREYLDTTSFDVPEPSQTSGTGDTIAKDIVTIRHDIGRRRCIYITPQLSNDTIDENVEIVGISYKVAGLSEKGILSAAKTK